MRHVHVVCDSQPNNPPIHAKHGNKQSGFRFAFASTFALLSLAFAPSATLLIFSSVFRLSQSSPPHCCSDQLGPLVRQGADHVLNVRARMPTHPQLAGKGTLLSAFPCLSSRLTNLDRACSNSFGALGSGIPYSPKSPATANPSSSEESYTDPDVAPKSV